MSYDKLDDTFNVSSEVVVDKPASVGIQKPPRLTQDDITKDYDDSITTQLAEDLITVDGKPVPRVLTVEDATNIEVSGLHNVYIDIDGEEMLVKSKTGNKVTVERGQDGTTIANHVKGAAIKSITAADNALVEEGDDFGFSGTVI